MHLCDIRINLKNNFGINPGDKIIIGVSGGPDSICLLDTLVNCELQINILNFNHHIRPESNEDSNFVHQVAKEYHLNYFQGEGEVAKYSKDNHLSIEEAARFLRYKYFFEQAKKINAVAVIVGHTADDQVETILMNLLRGCSLDGLKGMNALSFTEFDRQIPLVRPLLSFWRTEIIEYCSINHLEYVNDRSNEDKHFFRNRIRKELIPELEKYNHGLKKHIFQLGLSILNDLEIITPQIRDAVTACVKVAEENSVNLSIEQLSKYSLGIQKRVLRTGIQTILPARTEINYELISKILELIGSTQGSGHLQLIKNLHIYKHNNDLVLSETEINFIEKWMPRCCIEDFVQINIPGEANLGNQWKITVQNKELEEIKFPVEKMGRIFNAYLDFEKIDNYLSIRNQKPGDRYSPLGMNDHSIKVSDFWINNKIPHQARSSWPLVLSSDRIIWIPGFHPADFCKITDKTKKTVKISVFKVD